LVLTVITGGSIEGYSLTPRKLKPMTPNKTIMIEKTVAKTGLFILVLDKLIFLF
jgi:hypothetical protein